ncbi:MAG: hypothetical protein LBR79_07385 [Oscillospiraceae bacterium]|jgi:hypothetical protein|nr:hypothetical protein [Oscillospiraceae bacterium]
MGFKYNFPQLKQKFICFLAPILVITLSSCTLFNNETSVENIIREVTSEEQINAAYQKAKAVYLWFYYEPLSYLSYIQIKSGSSTSEELGPKLLDNLNYYKAKHGTINTYHQLENHLYTIFSEEIVNDLLNGENSKIKYKDIDKSLYGTVQEIRPPAQAGHDSYTVQKVNQNRYIYDLKVEILTENLKNTDHFENYEYIYEFVNDRWVFTKFHLFY